MTNEDILQNLEKELNELIDKHLYCINSYENAISLEYEANSILDKYKEQYGYTIIEDQYGDIYELKDLTIKVKTDPENCNQFKMVLKT